MTDRSEPETEPQQKRNDDGTFNDINAAIRHLVDDRGIGQHDYNIFNDRNNA